MTRPSNPLGLQKPATNPNIFRAPPISVDSVDASSRRGASGSVSIWRMKFVGLRGHEVQSCGIQGFGAAVRKPESLGKSQPTMRVEPSQGDDSQVMGYCPRAF